MIILLILLSFFEKSIKYIPLIIGEIVFIFFIISCATVQYDMNLLRYVLFFYLFYYPLFYYPDFQNALDLV